MSAPAIRSGEPEVGELGLRDVTVTFGGVQALKNVTLGFAASKVTALIGPNGAGKTTLLNVASGLLRPTHGSVILDERDISRLGPVKRARLGVARTFQQVSLFPELTVREHLAVAYFSQTRGVKTPWSAARMSREHIMRLMDDEAADELSWVFGDLELEGIADHAVGGLPLGTARLVNLARALVARPRVLLMDEPASGLAAHELDCLARAIRSVCASRPLVALLIEHNLEFAGSLCDHMAVLDFGVLIAEGDPQAVLDDPTVRAAYLGATDAGASNRSAHEGNDDA